MSNMTVQTAVCKSLQSVGLNPRKEHQIENALVIQLRSSGPEFVLARLSDLSDWRKMHMKGDTSYHPDWHAYKVKHGVASPSDPIGANLWGLSDKAFFSCLGAIRTAVQLDIPSEKQLTKWIEGVRCENKSTDYHLRGFASRERLSRLEKRLEQKWSGRAWFNLSDISGSNVPGSGKFMTVVRPDKVHPEPLSLLSAYGFSVSTAPLFIWQFFEDIDMPSRLADGVDCPNELIDSLSEIISSKLQDYVLEDEGMMGSSFLDDEQQLASRDFRNLRMGFQHSVGNIGFLEQPNGKLRTVANPNRLVQYANVPLGEVLSEEFYPRDGVFVENQEGGWRWAQEKLRNGVSLSSFDMSSATDRLDYQKYLHDYFRTAYREPDQFPLLVRSLELFEDTSQCNWTIPGHVADLCHINCGEVGWTVGQPLGLRPSFPILTMMNADFARDAVRSVDGRYTTGHFACVGDDLIIETKYADAYMAAVTAYNGKINNDKCIVSNRYAEFCSHMVTKSTVYPLKPRFLIGIDGSLSNVEKFTTKGLKPKVPNWCVEIHNQLARYHLDGFNTIKFSNSANPAPLTERIGVNTLIEIIEPASRDAEHVTLQTLYLRACQERERKGEMPPVRSLHTSYASDAYPKFGGDSKAPNVQVKYESQPSGYDFGTLGQVSTDTSTSVEVPVKKEWDFRKNSYHQPSSEISQAKSLRSKLSRMSIEGVGPLVEVTTKVKDVETSVLVDTSPDSPEVSVRYKLEKNKAIARSRAIKHREAMLREILDDIGLSDGSDDFSIDTSDLSR